MKKFSFTVDIVTNDLDAEVIVDTLTEAMDEALPSGVYKHVSNEGSKPLSEQGFKNWRARVAKVTVAMAGDGAAKPSKAQRVEREEVGVA